MRLLTVWLGVSVTPPKARHRDFKMNFFHLIKDQGWVAAPSLEGIVETTMPHGRERRGAGSGKRKKLIKVAV